MNRPATIVLAALAATTLVACEQAPPPTAAAPPAAEAVESATAGETAPADIMPAIPAANAIVVTLAVDGMHCDGCAAGVEAALVKLDGVRSCAVSFDEKSARVELDSPERTDAIVAAIEGLGYTVAPVG